MGEVIQRTHGTLKWKRVDEEAISRVQEMKGQENLTQHTFKTVIMIPSTALYANF